MLGHPDPTGDTLSDEQVRELDDAFFASDPLGYLHARIHRMMNPADDAPGVGLERLLELGLDPGLVAGIAPTEENLRIQVAVDAFALRHQAAELAVRLTAAVLRWASAGRRGSVWLELVDGPTAAVNDAKTVRSGGQESPIGLLITRDQAAACAGGSIDAEQADVAIRNTWGWILYAADILAGTGIDVNAAHNRIKHGFALRLRTDLKLDIAIAPQDGGEPDEIPFTTADLRPVIDSPSIQTLDRVKKWASPDANGSVELTVLSLRRDVLVAEALLIATAYGAVFASAASAYFADRPEHARPEHPGLIVGPTADEFRRRSVGGYRVPLTTSHTGHARAAAVSVFGETINVTPNGEHRAVVREDGTFDMLPGE